MKLDVHNENPDAAGWSPSQLQPAHILVMEFLTPFKLTREDLSKGTGMDIWTINGIVMGKIAISPEIGSKLDSFFGLDGGFWLKLQRDYDDVLRLCPPAMLVR
ncbi:HigA family addiction module antitoxin [Undibacterium sp.]|uniref:HigA family addiction module antitoxin n=1 Tax=Undibacterium sp. TaxID=1914977 RepID=UPI00374D9FD4